MVLQTFVRTMTQPGNSDYVAAVIRLKQGKCFVKIVQVQVSNSVNLAATSADTHMWQISKKALVAFDGALTNPDVLWAWSHTDVGATAVAGVNYPKTFRPMIPRFQSEGDLHILYDDAGDAAANVVTFKIIADITPARY